ncbi:ABC transporter substrate-binding protein [Dermabacteraceae bacterium P13103]
MFIPFSLSRHTRLRAFAFVALLLSLALLLASCGKPAGPPAKPKGEAVKIEHAMGTSEIPKNPQRVVVLDTPMLDAAVAVGVVPVGATTTKAAGNGFPTYLADKLKDTTPVGLLTEPDVDAIAKLNPDLIIGSKLRHEKIYDELAAIAPTVFTETSGTDWQNQANLTAQALGKQAEMTALIKQVDERAAQVGEKIQAKGKTVNMVRFRKDHLRLYGPNSFSGSLLEKVGFTIPKREWNQYSIEKLSVENYAEMNADYIFFTAHGGKANENAAGEVAKVWGQLPAVKAGHVYQVDESTWMTGIGVIGSNAALDDIEKAFNK